MKRFGEINSADNLFAPVERVAEDRETGWIIGGGVAGFVTGGVASIPGGGSLSESIEEKINETRNN